MRRLMLCLLLGGFAQGVLAEDWPQWRGPRRDGISLERGLLQEWPESGPKQVWVYKNAGNGYSGFAIVDGRLFTMGTRDGKAIMLALDAESGDEIWATPMGEIYENGWGDGPRGTPTVDGNRVYGLSGAGDLICATIDSGKKVWSVNMADFGGVIPNWGYAESVLVDGDQVICSPGGSEGATVALSTADGRLLWQTEELGAEVHYTSPIQIQRNGRPEYVQLFMDTLAGIAPDGDVRWTIPWDGRTAVCPTPVSLPNRDEIYITSGYGVGCMLVDVSDSSGEATASEVYANKVMKNHHGGVLLVDGHIYGYSDGAGWTCQAADTGAEVWAERNALGKGAIGYADGRLYCLDEETGEVVLIEASPESWKEHGRFVLDPQTEIRSSRGRIWTHPVISGGRLYLRDQDLIYCYDVRG